SLLHGVHAQRLRVLLCLLIIFGIGAIAEAQSGRRVPKRTESPPTTTTTTETETPPEAPKPKPEPPLIPLLVVNDIWTGTGSPRISSIVLGSCVERLKEASTFENSVGKDMNRKQASDRAKAEKETHVIWLQLEGDSTGSIRPNISDIYVDYVVYAPETAKA